MATINQNTQVPNFVLDACLPLLKEAELKTLLVIIRQTIGWIDRSTGKRKVRDRISNSQFRSKTGMSKRVITSAIQSLVDKGLVAVTDYEGRPLDTPLSRKGKSYLFFRTPNMCSRRHSAEQGMHLHQRRKVTITKITLQK